MSAFAKHTNILQIYGYGFNEEGGGTIPFLVTEFAAAGTLRTFLKQKEVEIETKLLLCRDVVHGLESLHIAGIAHGDLKLDNVLVSPQTRARISDFGHSLHIYEGQGDTSAKQRYGGTIAYNAPEILGDDEDERDNINFQKCDVWSLGLLCWEVLIDGCPYYYSDQVRRHAMRSNRSEWPSEQISSSATSLREDLITMAPHLANLACSDVSIKAQAAPLDLPRLLTFFHQCLEPNATRRPTELPQPPLPPKYG